LSRQTTMARVRKRTNIADERGFRALI